MSREERAGREAALRRAPLFADLPARVIRAIADVTMVKRYPAGREIVREGVRGSSFFVVLEGRARAKRRDRTLGRIGPGEFFGEISLLDPGPRTATVVAETPLVCLDLAGADFRELLARDVRLALRILRELARRVREGD